MSRSEQLRQLAVQLASLASLEDVVTHGIESLFGSPSGLVAPIVADDRALLAPLSRPRSPLPLIHTQRPLRAAVGQFCSASAALPLAWRSRVALERSCSPPSPSPPSRHQSAGAPPPPAPPPCPCLTARLLTLKRLQPSWLVRALPAPLRPGGAVATSVGGAHASKRNGPCGSRSSLKISAVPPCGLAVMIPRLTVTTTIPATPFCSCARTPSSRLCCWPGSRRWTICKSP